MMDEALHNQVDPDQGQTAQRMLQLILPGTTIDHLTTSAHIERDNITVAREVLKVWHAQQLPLIQNLLQQPLPEFPADATEQRIAALPGYTVIAAGQPICVHGIMHGLGMGGKGHRNDQFVDMVRRYVELTSQRGDKWVTEEGLTKDFGIGRFASELQGLPDEALRIANRVQTEHLGGFTKLKLVGKALADLVTSSALAPLSITFAQSAELRRVNKDLLEKCKNDPRYFLLYRQFLALAKLPEPMDMEVGLLLASVHNKEHVLGNNLIERSMAFANELKENTEHQKDTRGTLRVLVGAIHEPQVVYLLNNPTYNPIQSLQAQHQA